MLNSSSTCAWSRPTTTDNRCDNQGQQRDSARQPHLLVTCQHDRLILAQPTQVSRVLIGMNRRCTRQKRVTQGQDASWQSETVSGDPNVLTSNRFPVPCPHWCDFAWRIDHILTRLYRLCPFVLHTLGSSRQAIENLRVTCCLALPPRLVVMNTEARLPVRLVMSYFSPVMHRTTMNSCSGEPCPPKFEARTPHPVFLCFRVFSRVSRRGNCAVFREYNLDAVTEMLAERYRGQNVWTIRYKQAPLLPERGHFTLHALYPGPVGITRAFLHAMMDLFRIWMS
jgi:hypothetical protein